MKAYIQDDVIIRVEEIELYTEEQLKNMDMTCIDIDEYVEPYKYKYIDGKLVYNENYEAVKKRTLMTDENFQTLWDKVAILLNIFAKEELIDDNKIMQYKEDFVYWNKRWLGKAGDIVNEDEILYRSLHDVTNAAQNTRPSETPSMWQKIGKAGDELHEWVPHSLYNKGDMTRSKGKVWRSLVDNNVWEPGVIGTEALWEEVIV